MPPRTTFWGIFKIVVLCLFVHGIFESMYRYVYCVKWSPWRSLSTFYLNFLKKSFFGGFGRHFLQKQGAKNQWAVFRLIHAIKWPFQVSFMKFDNFLVNLHAERGLVLTPRTSFLGILKILPSRRGIYFWQGLERI